MMSLRKHIIGMNVNDKTGITTFPNGIEGKRKEESESEMSSGRWQESQESHPLNIQKEYVEGMTEFIIYINRPAAFRVTYKFQSSVCSIARTSPLLVDQMRALVSRVGVSFCNNTLR